MSARSIPLLPLSVLLALVALTFWLSHFAHPWDGRADGNRRHDPDLIIENFAARKLNAAGDVQYTVNAEKMTHFPDDDTSIMDNVVFTAIEPGQPRTTAKAPRGQLIRHADGTDEVVMIGGVVVHAEANDKYPALTLTTPKLTVLPDSSIVRSVDGVVLQGENNRLVAQRFELNSATRNLVFGRVKVTYNRPQ